MEENSLIENIEDGPMVGPEEGDIFTDAEKQIEYPKDFLEKGEILGDTQEREVVWTSIKEELKAAMGNNVYPPRIGGAQEVGFLIAIP